MATETTAITSAEPISVAVSGGFSDAPARSTQKRPLIGGFAAYPNGGHKGGFGQEGVYRECRRNHAAAIGGKAVDGCGEFMLSPEYDPADPASLRCAACDCHRSFHRRDPVPLQLHRYLPAPAPPPYFPAPAIAPAGGKKRVRTKFTEDQKEKMVAFSGRFGWKIQKIEKRVIDDFCSEVGVEREVLKVWLHNHKNKGGSVGINGGGAGGGAHNANNQFEQVHQLGSSGDGSSSSSSGRIN